MITYSFFGASHGDGYGGTICGLPDGFVFSVEQVNEILALRKRGYGRSQRQTMDDKVRFEGLESDLVTSRNHRIAQRTQRCGRQSAVSAIDRETNRRTDKRSK